jgi:ATP-dependent DNA helicase PIF1
MDISNTWTEAAMIHKVEETNKHKMRNWNILNECYDERDDLSKSRQKHELFSKIGRMFGSTIDEIQEMLNKNKHEEDTDIDTESNEFEPIISDEEEQKIMSDLQHIEWPQITVLPQHIVNPRIYHKIKEFTELKQLYKSEIDIIKPDNEHAYSRVTRPTTNGYNIVNPVTNAINFLQHNHDMNNLYKSIVSSFELYDDQKRALKLLIDSVEKPGISPLRMLVCGNGGSGKSHLIRSTTKYFDISNQSHKYLLVTPTGISACNIGGSTYHSIFQPHLYHQNKLDAAKTLEKLKYVETLLIDEFAMIASREFAVIAEILHVVFHNATHFGHLNVVLFGDPSQLQPITRSGPPLYFDPKLTKNQRDVAGHVVFSHFNIVVLLKQQKRQKDKDYIHLLNQVRVGACDSDALI